jgi:hypothetical protein
MDTVEVRMRCLELAAAHGGWETSQIIEAAEGLEAFVNAARVAQPAQTNDNSGPTNEAPTT